MCSVAGCLVMVLTGFTNNRFIFNQTGFVTRNVNSTPGLCTMKFKLVYSRLKLFLDFKLT